MLTIKRTCANKIITRVLAAEDQPFTAVLMPDAEDCIVTNHEQSLQDLVNQYPDAMIVYSQHPQAQTSLTSLNVDARQIVIEVRQETRGVLGLQARYINSAPDDVIELVYPENT